MEQDLILSSKQRTLIEIAEEKGVLKLRDLNRIYTNEYYALKIVERLVKFNYLKKVFFLNRWKLRED